MSGHSKWATTKHKKAVDRRQARQAVRQADQEHRGRGAHRRRRPRRQPDALRRHPEGEEDLGPQRQHRPRGQARRRARRPAAPTTQTIMYEGYGPNGVAVLIECLTDNRNRAAAEVRVAMTRNGGSMADPGSVSYLFTRKGVVIVPKSEPDRGRRPAWPSSTPAPRRSTTSATASRSSPTRQRPGRGAHRAAGGRHRLRVGRRRVPARACRSRSTRTAPARCSGSSTRSRTATTCRTSTPTSTSDEVLAARRVQRRARAGDDSARRASAAPAASRRAWRGAGASIRTPVRDGRTEGCRHARARCRPRPDPVRRGRGRRRARPAAHARARRRSCAPRPTSTSRAGCSRIEQGIEAVLDAHAPRRRGGRAGVQPSTTSAP